VEVQGRVQGFMTPGSVIPSCGRYYCKAANSRGLGINSAFVESFVAEMNSVIYTCMYTCTYTWTWKLYNSSNFIQPVGLYSLQTHTHTHTQTQTHTNTPQGPTQTETGLASVRRILNFTRIIICSQLKKILFYPHHFILPPYVILKVILYSMFYFICYILA